MFRYDTTAISRASKLRAEARMLREQSRGLRQRIRDSRAGRGLSSSRLMELAYDLTAIGLHDLSQACLVTAEEIGRDYHRSF